MIPKFKFCEEKVFRSYKHFFETLKPYSQETAQNIEKHVLQKCLRIAFYTYIPVNLYHFLEKHNRCTLTHTHTHTHTHSKAGSVAFYAKTTVHCSPDSSMGLADLTNYTHIGDLWVIVIVQQRHNVIYLCGHTLWLKK